MGLLRERDLGGARYRMREKMFDIGEDYWVEDANGDRVLKVNGKALRIRKTFVLETLSGEELLTVKERKLSVRDKMTIERDGDTVASVKKALVGPLRERYTIDVDGGEDLKAHGNIVDHEYEIERDGRTIARISKKWFRVRDTYGIEVAAGENDFLVVAAVVCIDQMSHERGR
jgi:uncharacterized protein YxjI